MPVSRATTSPSLPIWVCFLCLFLLDLLYGATLRQLTGIPLLSTRVIRAALFTGILYLSFRADLARLTVLYLALPYVLFFPGWLNTPTAIFISCLFFYGLQQTWQHSQCRQSAALGWPELLAFGLIVVWVNLSGAGGFGYQTPDYLMHRSRLNDLIDWPWPVRYGPDLNLVYYMAYYLPAAMMGKAFGFSVADHSLFFWALLGVTLAVRWVSQLSGWKTSVGLVLVCVFFGPLDIIGVLWRLYLSNAFSVLSSLTPEQLEMHSDAIDFWASDQLGLFLGSFPSNTFQLFWAPQHIIPGWLCISLMTYLFFTGNTRNLAFVFCLMCLWSPLVMLSMTGFMVIALLHDNPLHQRDWLAVRNTLNAAVIAAFFLLYYLGGSALINVSGWLLPALNLHTQWITLLLFYLCTWGVYAAVLLQYRRALNKRQHLWLCGLLITMTLLPLYRYGEYSDLLCRGAAPAMFLLMILLLQRIKAQWAEKRYFTITVLAVLFSLGSVSALLQLYVGIKYYGETEDIIPVTSYQYAKENLGIDNSLFGMLFRKHVMPSPQGD